MAQVKINRSAYDLLNVKVSAKTLIVLGDFWKQRIYSFTKSGKSLATNAKLKPLSKSYVSQRAKYKGPFGALFGIKKSNLTRTGQMLDSLKNTQNISAQTVTIKLSGSRDDGVTNEQVAKWVAEQGRPFLGLDEKGRQRMIQIVLRDLRRQLKKRPR